MAPEANEYLDGTEKNLNLGGSENNLQPNGTGKNSRPDTKDENYHPDATDQTPNCAEGILIPGLDAPPTIFNCPAVGNQQTSQPRVFRPEARPYDQSVVRLFRHVLPGQGGTFLLVPKDLAIPAGNGEAQLLQPDSSELSVDERITAIGTSETGPSVGVYAQLDDQRCFVAHINILPPSGPSAKDPDAQNKALKHLKFILESRLDQERRYSSWSPKVMDLMKRTLTFACAMPTKKSHLIMDTIQDYFNLDKGRAWRGRAVMKVFNAPLRVDVDHAACRTRHGFVICGDEPDREPAWIRKADACGELGAATKNDLLDETNGISLKWRKADVWFKGGPGRQWAF